MAIPTKCTCGFSFSAKDALAGKRVKCPRCAAVIQVADPRTAAVGAAVGGAAAAPQVNKKLLDLLDDVGVKATPKGPICAACGTEMNPTAVICVECGYNVATGQYLDTYTDSDMADDLDSSGMTDAEKAMAKAEKEIMDSPIGADDQDFGDGADSYVIAMAAFAIFAVLILMGLGVVLIMEAATDAINTGLISAVASTAIYFGCGVWLTIVAMKSQQPRQVSMCISSVGLFCPVYGIMRGSGTIAVSIVMIVSGIIGAASFAYCLSSGVFG